MSRLRANQRRLLDGIYDAWNKGATCVIGCMGTGGGKTVTMATAVKELQGYGVIEAHRSELVGQISMALAKEGIRHNITASKKTIKAIVKGQMEEYGVSFFDPRAAWNVASVDTIIRRPNPLADQIRWLFQDEGHHTLRENKWGRAASMYPNSRVLLMTATPTRADGKGLGAHADGIADAIVLGPGLGELIREGYLTNYDVFSPDVGDLDLSGVHIGASGEFNQQELAVAVKRSRKIVGDVVSHYLDHARGKRGITFAVDIEHAELLTAAFNAAGVPAALVTADTDEDTRRELMKKFKVGALLQLVNVDLFGEGVDVPAVECVSMARPTASFALYCQQIGRMLRLNVDPVHMAPGVWDSYTIEQRLHIIATSPKPVGILLDHVGNVRRAYNVGGIQYCGLPEGFQSWTLDARSKRTRGPADDAIPMRKCLECFKAYERIYDCCPHCGTAAPEPTNRSAPEFVDGRLDKLDAATLARMRGEVARIDAPVLVPQGLPEHARVALMKAHNARQLEQRHLRDAIAHWAGMFHNDTDNVNYARFFYKFGMSVLDAMTLNAKDAAALTTKINAQLGRTLQPLPLPTI